MDAITKICVICDVDDGKQLVLVREKGYNSLKILVEDNRVSDLYKRLVNRKSSSTLIYVHEGCRKGLYNNARKKRAGTQDEIPCKILRSADSLNYF